MAHAELLTDLSSRGALLGHCPSDPSPEVRTDVEQAPRSACHEAQEGPRRLAVSEIPPRGAAATSTAHPPRGRRRLLLFPRRGLRRLGNLVQRHRRRVAAVLSGHPTPSAAPVLLKVLPATPHCQTTCLRPHDGKTLTLADLASVAHGRYKQFICPVGTCATRRGPWRRRTMTRRRAPRVQPELTTLPCLVFCPARDRPNLRDRLAMVRLL